MRFQTLHRNFLNIIASVDVPDIHAMQVGAPSIMSSNQRHKMLHARVFNVKSRINWWRCGSLVFVSYGPVSWLVLIASCNSPQYCNSSQTHELKPNKQQKVEQLSRYFTAKHECQICSDDSKSFPAWHDIKHGRCDGNSIPVSSIHVLSQLSLRFLDCLFWTATFLTILFKNQAKIWSAGLIRVRFVQLRNSYKVQMRSRYTFLKAELL